MLRAMVVQHKLPGSARKFIRREKARFRATLADARAAEQAIEKLIEETRARYSKKKNKQTGMI